MSNTEVPAAISKAIGLALQDGDPIAQVIEHLADKQCAGHPRPIVSMVIGGLRPVRRSVPDDGGRFRALGH